MSEIQSIYEKLYSSDIDHDDSVLNNFGLDLNFPILSEKEKTNLEGKITLEECKKILNTL